MQNFILKYSEEFEKRIRLIQTGKDVAFKYCEFDNSVFYLIVNRHLGDSLRTLRSVSSIKEYYGKDSNRIHFQGDNIPTHTPSNFLPRIEKNKYINKLYIICSQSNAGVAKLYGEYIDGIIILQPDEITALESYAVSACSVHYNIVCDEQVQKRIFRSPTDEGQHVRAIMFGIQDMEWDMCFPSHWKMCKPKITTHIDSETDSFLRDSKNIDVSKSVVLCPAAKSTSVLEYSIWKKFVKYIQSLGYTVFTNAPKNEIPIDGTISLDCSIDILACLGKRGLKIVTVQSGLSDVLRIICPENLMVLFIIQQEKDLFVAANRGVTKEGCTVKKEGSICLRIEHFEEGYVLKLFMDNFAEYFHR